MDYVGRHMDVTFGCCLITAGIASVSTDHYVCGSAMVLGGATVLGVGYKRYKKSRTLPSRLERDYVDFSEGDEESAGQ